MIGDRIRKYRKYKELKLVELSKIIGVSHGTLSDIERNKTKPSSDTIISVVRHTSINPMWLLTGDGEMLVSMEKESLSKDKDREKDIDEITSIIKEKLKIGYSRDRFSGEFSSLVEQLPELKKIADLIKDEKDISILRTHLHLAFKHQELAKKLSPSDKKKMERKIELITELFAI